MKGVLPSKEQAKEITKTFKAMTAASIVSPYIKQMLDTMIEASGVAEIPTLFLEKLADSAAEKTADTIHKWLDDMAAGKYDNVINNITGAFEGFITEADNVIGTFDQLMEKTGLLDLKLQEFMVAFGAAIINPLSLFYPLFDKMAAGIDKITRSAYQFANVSMKVAGVSDLGIEGEMPTGSAWKLTSMELMGGY